MSGWGAGDVVVVLRSGGGSSGEAAYVGFHYVESVITRLRQSAAVARQFSFSQARYVG